MPELPGLCDFDGDAQPEILNAQPTPQRFEIIETPIGNGPPVTVEVTEATGQYLAVGDLEQDGKEELISLRREASGDDDFGPVTVELTRGSPGLSTAPLFSLCDECRPGRGAPRFDSPLRKTALIDDLDGDGNADVAVLISEPVP